MSDDSQSTDVYMHSLIRFIFFLGKVSSYFFQ